MAGRAGPPDPPSPIIRIGDDTGNAYVFERGVEFRHGDGSLGWPAYAPFDGILVAAAPLRVPEALLEQLAIGGRLIMPIGPEGRQELTRFIRREQKIDRQTLGPVAFVPLVGGAV